MEWKLTGNSPIWIQLKDQIGKMIVSGYYSRGERLPSVRDLAKDAGVNPNTMQRALVALDQEGLIITSRTSGRCVTDDDDLISRFRIMIAQNIITDYIESMAELGFTKEDAILLLQKQQKK